MKELIFSDDLVLLGDRWEEVKSRYSQWKRPLKDKGVKVNENKTTALHTGRKAKRHWVTSTHVLCVQKNSIKCTKCENYAQDMLRNSGKHKKKQEILHPRDAGVCWTEIWIKE